MRSSQPDLKISYFKNFVSIFTYEEETIAETLLKKFYNNLSDEDKLLYSEMADFAIELVISQSKKAFPGYEIRNIISWSYKISNNNQIKLSFGTQAHQIIVFFIILCIFKYLVQEILVNPQILG